MSGRETRGEDWKTEDDDGEIGPRLFRLPVSCLSLSLHSGRVFSLSLKSRSLYVGFCNLSVSSPFLSHLQSVTPSSLATVPSLLN